LPVPHAAAACVEQDVMHGFMIPNQPK